MGSCCFCGYHRRYVLFLHRSFFPTLSLSLCLSAYNGMEQMNFMLDHSVYWNVTMRWETMTIKMRATGNFGKNQKIITIIIYKYIWVKCIRPLQYIKASHKAHSGTAKSNPTNEINKISKTFCDISHFKNKIVSQTHWPKFLSCEKKIRAEMKQENSLWIWTFWWWNKGRNVITMPFGFIVVIIVINHELSPLAINVRQGLQVLSANESSIHRKSK